MEKVGIPPSSSGDYSGPGDAGGKGALGHDVGVVPAGDPQGISTHRSLILFFIIYIVNIAHWIWLLYFLNLRIEITKVYYMFVRGNLIMWNIS